MRAHYSLSRAEMLLILGIFLFFIPHSSSKIICHDFLGNSKLLGVEATQDLQDFLTFVHYYLLFTVANFIDKQGFEVMPWSSLRSTVFSGHG
eukprot:m.346538 g.346538  ORF g.346538 m.346538 type:complete len:92 (+) comp29514_c0_seq1:156-431(+)